MHSALAGTAAVVAAAVGGVHSLAHSVPPAGGSPGPAPVAADVGVQAAALDGQLRLVRTRQVDRQRKIAHEREVRASRERARLSLLEKRRQQAAAQQAAAQRAAAQRSRSRVAADRAGRSARSYVAPLNSYRLTARFGATGLWSRGHTGLDLAAPSGAPVRAVTAGRVTSAEWAGAYGWQVVIRHADGSESWYCHLSAMSASAGDAVQAGEVIGRVGSTGNTTGPHLHLEVRVGGNPIDPAPWLRARGVNL
jgi:murein DD-endopeptidase MepM/ murein hydrolase activator NlpD